MTLAELKRIVDQEVKKGLPGNSEVFFCGGNDASGTVYVFDIDPGIWVRREKSDLQPACLQGDPPPLVFSGTLKHEEPGRTS